MIHLPPEGVLVGRVLLGGLLGGIVGLEREISHHPAGLRTHVSLGLGAALFGVLSVGGFGLVDVHAGATPYRADLSRIAANVVVGVGFLGGGAILKDSGRVRGLTTAASLWVAAAIGLGAGLGLYLVSGVTCVVLVGALAGLRPLTRWLGLAFTGAGSTLQISLDARADPARAVDIIGREPGVRLLSLRFIDEAEGRVVSARVAGPDDAIERLIGALGADPAVVGVEQDR